MLDALAFGLCLLIAALLVWIATSQKKPKPRIRPPRAKDYDLASGRWNHPRAHERITPQAGGKSIRRGLTGRERWLAR